MGPTYEQLLLEKFLRERNTLTWRTKDGKEIPLSELSDEHLNAIIICMERRQHKQMELDEALESYFSNYKN